jgi:phage tail-like protein
MADTNYLVGFNFSLSYKGKEYPFKEISGISREYGVEEVRSGGEYRFKYRLPTAMATPKNLVLKRAVESLDNPLSQWCTDTLKGNFSSPIKAQSIAVNLFKMTNAKGKAKKGLVKKWTFHKAYPIKYDISDLKSQENELLFETIELAYTYFD